MESSENKVMAVLAYFGILVLIPIFAGEKKGFVRKHVNQGLNLSIIILACRILSAFFGRIPLIGWIVGLISGLICLVAGVLAIVGIIFAIQGKSDELPIVGSIKLLSE